MAIELYVFPMSPRAFKPMVVANHLGLDCQIRLLDMMQGAHKSKDYAAMNPNMRMPTMKDGDWVLWESEAIIQYLALQKPESNSTRKSRLGAMPRCKSASVIAPVPGPSSTTGPDLCGST